MYVSERTYADLERGDMTTPSMDFLDGVAEVLRMEEQERTVLYVYALGHEPPISRDPQVGTRVASAWHAAVNRVTGMPCYVQDVVGNVLAANDDFVRMFPQVSGEKPRLPEQNMIRWMLLRRDAREHHLMDWETSWAEPVAAQLRTAVAAHPDNEALQQLDKEVTDDPVVGPIYRYHNLAYVHPDGDSRPMRHAGFVPNGVRSFTNRCCDRHALSQIGTVTMCAAQPLGNPGTRFFVLLFEPRNWP